MSDLARLLAEAKAGRSIDVIAEEATQAGHPISRSTIAKYLRDEHRGQTPEPTLQALAAGFGLDVRELREMAGRNSGEPEPYVPDPRAASLTKDQRDALDRLIVTIVTGGQTHGDGTPDQKMLSGAATPEELTTSEQGDLALSARRARSRGKVMHADAAELGEETQDPGGLGGA